jgi:hypothetical protein
MNKIRGSNTKIDGFLDWIWMGNPKPQNKSMKSIISKPKNPKNPKNNGLGINSGTNVKIKNFKN